MKVNSRSYLVLWSAGVTSFQRTGNDQDRFDSTKTPIVVILNSQNTCNKVKLSPIIRDVQCRAAKSHMFPYEVNTDKRLFSRLESLYFIGIDHQRHQGSTEHYFKTKNGWNKANDSAYIEIKTLS